MSIGPSDPTLRSIAAGIWRGFTAAERTADVPHVCTAGRHRVDERTEGADAVDPSDAEGGYALPLLARCAAVGRIDDMRTLIAAGTDPMEHGRGWQYERLAGVALCVAVATGHRDAVRLLLDAGADPRIDEPYCRHYPVWLAASIGQASVGIMEDLVAAGVDPMAGGYQGIPAVAMSVAAAHGDIPLMAWFRARGHHAKAEHVAHAVASAGSGRPGLLDDLLAHDDAAAVAAATMMQHCRKVMMKHVDITDRLIMRLDTFAVRPASKAFVVADPRAVAMQDVWRMLHGRRFRLSGPATETIRSDQVIRGNITRLLGSADIAEEPRLLSVFAAISACS